MSDFIPTSILYIGRVPWDNSYRDFRLYDTTQAQETHIMEHMDTRFEVGTYTYIRPDKTRSQAVRVPFNAELLYNENYMMFKNRNYGNKWFFAFIDDVKYINENCTEIEFEIDVLQTFWHDVIIRYAFVERRHVSKADDNIGDWILPEPDFGSEYSENVQYTHLNANDYLVMVTVGYPTDDRPDLVGCDPIGGGIYDRQYSASAFLVYNLNEPLSVKRLKEDLSRFAMRGVTDAIQDMFTVSVEWLDWTNDCDDFKVEHTMLGDVAVVKKLKENNLTQNLKRDVEIHCGNNLGSYIPKNKKMLTFPYHYVTVCDFKGAAWDYRFEYSILEDNGEPFIRFQEYAPICSNMGLLVSPVFYNGTSTLPSSEVFSTDISNHVPWTYDYFLNSTAQSIIPLMTGLANTAATSAMGVVFQDDPTDKAKSVVGGLTQAASELVSFAGNRLQAAATPNQTRGNVSGNTLYQSLMLGVRYVKHSMREDYAKTYDDFFTMYGYTVNKIEIPTFHERPTWDYVKLSDVCLLTNMVPNDYSSTIRQILLNGLTFWHTEQVGNYNLSNE